MTSSAPREVATIGYEGTSVARFLETLHAAQIDLLVDVRAVANSRRPGFSKKQLTANLAEAGIDYLHLRGLGTPAEGRAAARAHKYDRLQEVYSAHLDTTPAQVDMHELADRVRSGRRVCLLCLEADPVHCHRSMVVEELGEIVAISVNHLRTF
jgi:uncharacterized protein (DUF488 family)